MLYGGLHYEDKTRPGVHGWLETGDDSSNPPTFLARLHTKTGVVKVKRKNLVPRTTAWLFHECRAARQRKREVTA
jgi:hypothetical protein